MNQHTTKLSSKVAAVNRVNAEANRLCALTVEALRPFIGKKVRLVTGALTKQVEAILPRPAHNMHDEGHRYDGFQFTPAQSRYCLTFWVRCIEPLDDGGCTYGEQTFSIGNLDRHDNILQNVSAPSPRRTDWTVQEIINIREQAEAARYVMHDCEFKLSPFGMHDNF